MKKGRFIIMLDSETDTQVTNFATWININGLGYWHWIAGSWLIKDPKGSFSAKAIRDQLGLTHPGVRCIVFGVPEESASDWSGFGPTGSQNSMFEWLNTVWLK